MWCALDRLQSLETLVRVMFLLVKIYQKSRLELFQMQHFKVKCKIFQILHEFPIVFVSSNKLQVRLEPHLLAIDSVPH